MTLGILAHEIGHVLWWDKSILSRECMVNGTYQSFYGSTWSSVSLKQPRPAITVHL